MPIHTRTTEPDPTRVFPQNPSGPPKPRILHTFQVLATAFSLAGASMLGGCKSEPSGESGSKSATARATSEKPSQPSEPRRPSARMSGVPWRPLTDEARRAELHVDGLVVDLGTADQHKYTRGGWRTGWGENKQDGDAFAGQIDDARALLDVVTTDDVAEIVVRARSRVSRQSLRVYVGNVEVGNQPIGPEWQLLRMPVKAGVMAPGRHEITLRLAQAGSPRAELDWMWFAKTAGAEPPTLGPRVLPVRIGDKPKRALMAPTPRTLSFYLAPAADSFLVFDYGSEVGATFTVTAHVDGAPANELFSEKGESRWREAKIDLGAFADKATRLELTTSGEPGVSGWGEPVIMRGPAAKPKRKTIGQRPKNVIVILIDTVRADAFGALEPGSKVKTPAYDRLAAKSTLFTSAYNNENWTKPSVATTLSGVYPSTHQTKRDDSALPTDLTILPEHLKDHGFMTAGFVANGYVSRKFGFDKGWDHFTNYIRESKSSEAERVYGDALAWLKEQRQQDAPFFLYVQTIDPHVVYSVDKGYTSMYFDGEYTGFLGPAVDATEQVAMSKGQKKASERDLAWLRALYYGEITYHDEHMGKFLDEVEKMGLFQDTVIVVTNDHGEELGERGKFGHGHSLYQEMIRAPLLMHFPPIFDAGARIDEIVESVDITPTLLEVLGIEPMRGADGQSFLPLVTGEPVSHPRYAITEFLDGRRAARVGNYAYMRSSGTWMHLFDLAADPDEKNDLIASHAIARRMGEIYLGEGLATPDKSKRALDMASRRRMTSGKAVIDKEARRQLEALGYFGDTPDTSEDDSQD